MNNIRSTLSIVWRIAAPYFRSEDKRAGRWLLAAVIAIELALVGNSVLLNQWRNRFYNALQEKDWDGFVREIIVFSVLATVLVVLSIYQLYLNQWLQIRWRRWMTTKYLGEWLHNANHYRMQLKGDAADNPDQRITDDVKLFVDQTLNIGVGLLSAMVTLASFVVILWGLSAAAPLHVFGREFAIPGYLVWGALIYAIFGTALTQWIGSPLVNLDFRQQRFEADFRFNLVRVRENSEQIALLRGETAERQRLSERFGRVVDNWYAIMQPDQAADGVYLKLLAGRGDFPLHSGGAGLFRGQDPARRHDADRIRVRQRAKGAVVLRFGVSDAGGMARRGGAPRRVRDGDRQRRDAEKQRRIDRSWWPRPAATRSIWRSCWSNCPTARRWSRPTASAFAAIERTLVTGPSGAGKSTLFRAIAGVWPFGSGSIAIPAKATLMMLPQRPYFPVGSLKAAIVYPAEAERVQFGSGQGGADLGGPARARAATGGRSPLESHAFARRAAAPRAGARLAARAAISVPRRGDRLAR